MVGAKSDRGHEWAAAASERPPIPLRYRLLMPSIQQPGQASKGPAAAAVEADGHVQRGEALLGTPFSIAAELASGEQMAIDTELGRLDIVQGLEGVPSFDELRSRATATEVLGVNVAVCSVEDLRAM